MPDQPPPRHRFQFRLRTLMIVVTLLALFCAYVGRQLKWIADRHEAAAIHAWVLTEIFPSPIPEAPWPLRWFGEEAYWGLDAGDNASDDDVADLKRLFPEAVIWRGAEKH